jgi:hypothetical protein
MGEALPGSDKSYESAPDEVEAFKILAEHGVVELTGPPTQDACSWQFTQQGIQRLRYSSGLSAGTALMQPGHEVRDVRGIPYHVMLTYTQGLSTMFERC